MSKRTSYLVVGATDLRQMGDSGRSGKRRKALDLAVEGSPIQIVDETGSSVCSLALVCAAALLQLAETMSATAAYRTRALQIDFHIRTCSRGCSPAIRIPGRGVLSPVAGHRCRVTWQSSWPATQTRMCVPISLHATIATKRC